jgi:hypothetical protein
MTKVSVRETDGARVDVNWSIVNCQIVNQPRVFWEVITLPRSSRNQLSNGHKDPQSALKSSRSLNLLSIWPVRVVYEGIPLIPVLAASGMLILVAAVAGALIWIHLRSPLIHPTSR